MSQSDRCPDESTLLRYATKSLDEETTTLIEQHIATCEKCRVTLTKMETQASLAAETQTYLPHGKFEDLDQKFDPRLLSPSSNPSAMGRLGEYDILQVIGCGGMGVVLAAHDAKLDRSVAIKVLSRHLVSSSKARARFSREARAAAGVKHANVVTIHSVEKHKGNPFLVMEYIDGITLHDKITGGKRMNPIEILRISSQIASGLAAAHEKGVVHRDIKPLNIMLEGKLEDVKLTDFGLARITIDNEELSSVGETVGTPAFMSPEQVTGEQIDGRSDLFSLGVVMYAMVEGFSPFRGGTLIEVIRKISDVHPKALHESAKNCPQFLSRVVGRLLEKEPDKRYQTAAEVVKILEYQYSQFNMANTDRVRELLDDGSILEPRSVSSNQGRNKSRFIATVVILLAVMCAIAWRFGDWRAGAGNQNQQANGSGGGNDWESEKEHRKKLIKQLTRERVVAKWVLEHDGVLEIAPIRNESKRTRVTRIEDLPGRQGEENEQNVDLLLHGFYVKHVDLSGTAVRDEDLQHIVGLSRIFKLQLHETNIEGPGIKYLSSLDSLVYLGMKNCPVSDEGLAPLAKLVNLEQLNLMDTTIGDGACEHLRDLTNLRRLFLAAH